MEANSQNARRELKAISLYLKGEVSPQNGIQVLKIDQSIGEGQVRCVYLENGLLAIEFDIVLKENHLICLDRKKDVVQFLYCLKGSSFHKFKNDELVTKLEELQTAVISSGVDVSSQLIVNKEERFIFHTLSVDKKRYATNYKWNIDGVEHKIEELLSSFKSNRRYFHSGKFNLEIGELIKKLEHTKHLSDLSSVLHFQGICHLIFAKQVEQFYIDMDAVEGKSSTLLQRELLKIVALTDFIKTQPEIQHSVASLCSRSSLSASKLQQGFRFIHNMTISEYIRNIRLTKAEVLIRTTDMNISEVVYTIGLTSRSYFCKIFKQKYGCSPKQYKSSVVQTRFKVTV